MLGERSSEATSRARRRRAPALVGRDSEPSSTLRSSRARPSSRWPRTPSTPWSRRCSGSPSPARPAPLAHRAANTLDAMVGHRTSATSDFGWAAARLDDAANWLPARAHRGARDPRRTDRRRTSARRALGRHSGTAPRHPSPNAGRVEAAFAGALSLRLGGLNRYGDRFEQRPFLGDGELPTVADIRRAVALARTVGLAAVVACSGLGLTAPVTGLVVLIGGARSGKSRLAVRLASQAARAGAVHRDRRGR